MNHHHGIANWKIIYAMECGCILQCNINIIIFRAVLKLNFLVLGSVSI